MERAERASTRCDLGQNIQQIARRAGEPVETAYQNGISGLNAVEQTAKLRTVSIGPTQLFLQHAVGTSDMQRINLSVECLPIS